MDFRRQLKELAQRVEKLQEHIQTEEATKTVCVLPFIQILGYDIFNPKEVTPEFTADLGTKKHEKVDYAILKDQEPIIIIECKHISEELELHKSQLFRYFHVTPTRFAILTNGIDYYFYSDLESKNKMDTVAFLEFSINNLQDGLISEIEKFHKSNFDIDTILNRANSLRCITALKRTIRKEIQDPSVVFIKALASQVHSGNLWESVLTEYKNLITKAFTQIISEQVNQRLNIAIQKEAEQQKSEQITAVDKTSKIVTTDEEKEAFEIIKAILRKALKKDKIFFRDTVQYCSVLYENTNRKPICRLYLNNKTAKYLGLFDAEKHEHKIKINDIDDIYNHTEELLRTAKHYETA